MRAGRPDWLDSLARFTASDSPRLIRVNEPAVAYANSTQGERLSRATALRRGAIVAASVSLGVWKAPLANAQTQSRGECFDLCVEGVDGIYTEKIRGCDYVLKPESWDKKGWDAVRFSLRYWYFSFVWDTYMEQAYAHCRQRAYKESFDVLDKCFQQCRDNCRPKRSLQSTSSGTQTCEYKPPTKPKPPEIPTLPPTLSEPGPCSFAPAGSYCCRLKSGDWVPCYTGCDKGGDGCCSSLSCD